MEPAPTPPPSSSGTNWVRVTAAGLLALLAFRALALFLFWYDMLDYPLDYGAGEGDFLVLVARLLRGQSIYKSGPDLPILWNVYPPLYFWIAGGAAHVLGTTLAALRLVALFPLLGTTLLVAWYVRRAGAPAAYAACAALLVPGCYSLSQYLAMPRCDGWMVFFGWLSLCLLERSAPRRREILAGGLCTALALFCKQTLAPGAAAVHLDLLIRRPRTGWAAAGVAAASGAVLFSASYLEFGGAFVDSVVLRASRRAFEFERLWTMWLPLASGLGVLILACAARMVIHLRARQWTLLDSYLAGHGLASLLILYDGAAGNYLLPLLPGLCAGAALCAWEFLSQVRLRAVGLAVTAAALLLQVALQVPQQRAVTPPQGTALQEARVAVQFLASTSEPVYVERLWGPIAGAAQGQENYVEPVHFRELPEDAPDRRALEAAFASRRFARVIVQAPNFHWPGFVEMVSTYYVLVRTGVIKMPYGDVQLLYLVRPVERQQQGSEVGTEGVRD